MTIREAQTIARENGYTLRKRDGEYRVNKTGGEEATAHYTDDLDDAIGTVRFEAKREAAQVQEEVKPPEVTLTVREQNNYGNIVHYPVGSLASLFARLSGTETLTDRNLSMIAKFGRDEKGKITGDVGYKIEVQRPPAKKWR